MATTNKRKRSDVVATPDRALTTAPTAQPLTHVYMVRETLITSDSMWERMRQMYTTTGCTCQVKGIYVSVEDANQATDHYVREHIIPKARANVSCYSTLQAKATQTWKKDDCVKWTIEGVETTVVEVCKEELRRSFDATKDAISDI